MKTLVLTKPGNYSGKNIYLQKSSLRPNKIPLRIAVLYMASILGHQPLSQSFWSTTSNLKHDHKIWNIITKSKTSSQNLTHHHEIWNINTKSETSTQNLKHHKIWKIFTKSETSSQNLAKWLSKFRCYLPLGFALLTSHISAQSVSMLHCYHCCLTWTVELYKASKSDTVWWAGDIL